MLGCQFCIERARGNNYRSFSILKRVFHGTIYSLVSGVPVILLVTAIAAVLGEVDGPGHLFIGFLTFLLVGMLFIVGAVILLGIPIFLALNFANLTHWGWMVVSGIVSGALVYVTWQGWPRSDFGLYELEYLVLFFVLPGGLIAAAFWYGAQRHN